MSCLFSQRGLASAYWNDGERANSSVQRDSARERGGRVTEQQAAVGGDRGLLEVHRPPERHADVLPQRRAAVVRQHDAIVLAGLLGRAVGQLVGAVREVRDG